MTIAEAEKKCDELQKQIKIIKEEYLMSEGYAKYMGEQEIKPVYDEWNKLMSLINKTKNETKLT
ncbi:MAG TPA: hypothetical protein ENH82_14125 [bacterium]|nr:hypothetical protein [bacterium]